VVLRCKVYEKKVKFGKGWIIREQEHQKLPEECIEGHAVYPGGVNDKCSGVTGSGTKYWEPLGKMPKKEG